MRYISLRAQLLLPPAFHSVLCKGRKYFMMKVLIFGVKMVPKTSFSFWRCYGGGNAILLFLSDANEHFPPNNVTSCPIKISTPRGTLVNMSLHPSSQFKLTFLRDTEFSSHTVAARSTKNSLLNKC